MANSFKLSISTPDRQFFDGECESLVVSSQDGEMGILPGHLSMVITLISAPARIKVNGEWKIAAISGGFARIKGDSVIILADTAEWPEEIEINRAERARQRAEERVKAHVSEVEYMRSRVALERALMRLTVKNDKQLWR